MLEYKMVAETVRNCEETCNELGVTATLERAVEDN